VRNPVGSRHTPHTEGGCLILVKLWWMHPDDQEFVHIDTTRRDLWRPGDAAGVEIMPLHRFGHEFVALYRLAPGAELAARALPGGEEIFVLDGACRDADGSYEEGAWTRRPIGAAPALGSNGGCRLYVKRGHLLHPPPAPSAH
jgi:anti-sigma factor ChrR (cupin superfamily)